MKEKPSSRLMKLTLQGLKVLRPHYNCRQLNWSIYYFTNKGGWARLDTYCKVAYDTKVEAEIDIDSLVKLLPDKFVKEPDDNAMKDSINFDI